MWINGIELSEDLSSGQVNGIDLMTANNWAIAFVVAALVLAAVMTIFVEVEKK